MFATRPARIFSLGLLLAPALAAQVPSASDPPRYALPPKEIVEAFDAPGLPASIISPSRQVMALVYRKNQPTKIGRASCRERVRRWVCRVERTGITRCS